MADLKQLLVDRCMDFWDSAKKHRPEDFKQDFADHIIGAATEFYQDQSWEKFGVWQFHVYPIPAKSWEDAKKILLRVYDIWEPSLKN